MGFTKQEVVVQFPQIELPSNNKFGFFFAVLFSVIAGYMALTNSHFLAFGLASISLTMATVTILKPDLLTPLNRAWMCIGLILGAVVNPLVCALLFFLIFTPIGIVTRLARRDVLRLRENEKGSFWMTREDQTRPETFKQQF